MSNAPDTHSESRDVRDYLRPILSRWWLVVPLAVIAAVLAYRHYEGQPGRYESATLVLIKSNSTLDQILLGTDTAGSDAEKTARNQATLLRTSDVARVVAKKIGYKGDPRALLGAVSATPIEDTDFLQITGMASEPETAALIANGFASAFIAQSSRELTDQASDAKANALREIERMKRTGTGSNQARRALASRVDRLELIEAFPANNAKQIEPAVPSLVAVQADPKKNAIFAFALALLVGSALAYMLEVLDRRIRRSDDVESLYGLPTLGQLPQGRSIDRVVDGRPATSPEMVEPFRSLRTSLQLMSAVAEESGGGALRTVLVTSAVSGEGKSTVVRNLAIAYAEAGRSVCVIDADLRGPSVAHMLGVRPEPGLVDVLTGERGLNDSLQGVYAHLEDARAIQAVHALSGTPIDERRTGAITILTAGRTPADPGSMLAGKGFRDVLDACAAMHDIVLVDTTPLLSVSDAVPLLSVVDGVVLVSRIGVTTRAAALKAASTVERMSNYRFAAVITNGVRGGDDLHSYPSSASPSKLTPISR